MAQGQKSEAFAVIKALAKDPANKSIGRQATEIIALFGRSQLGPNFYLKAKLYKKGVRLGTVLGFLSYKQYKHRVFQLNDRLYHRCSQNKSIEKALLTAYGVPTPELLGHFHPNRGFTIEGNELRTGEHLSHLFQRQAVDSQLCLKLVESWGGQGFRVVKRLPDSRVLEIKSGQEHVIDEFCTTVAAENTGGLLIERYLDQHPEYSRFNPSSVNTLRILVRNNGNQVVCLAAYLRAGRTGSLVDNSAAGGVTFPINIETGIMGKGHTKHDRTILLDGHPDSKIDMYNVPVPLFFEGLALAKHALLVFPGINFAGVDVAFSKDGPAILELNLQPDYNDFADTCTPSRAVLS